MLIFLNLDTRMLMARYSLTMLRTFQFSCFHCMMITLKMMLTRINTHKKKMLKTSFFHKVSNTAQWNKRRGKMNFQKISQSWIPNLIATLIWMKMNSKMVFTRKNLHQKDKSTTVPELSWPKIYAKNLTVAIFLVKVAIIWLLN